ncbi:hypothetical protein [Jeotgalibacillus proteolyticus]|uniref:hypothetical protein n=1 Tax=Jeotgalibacillus proteolyticus TaxID=2082395 RepID=UPI003CFB3FE1
MAWCLIKGINGPVIKLLHGSDVEANDYFFIKGAWDGEYAKKKFTLLMLLWEAVDACKTLN